MYFFQIIILDLLVRIIDFIYFGLNSFDKYFSKFKGIY